MTIWTGDITGLAIDTYGDASSHLLLYLILLEVKWML